MTFPHNRNTSSGVLCCYFLSPIEWEQCSPLSSSGDSAVPSHNPLTEERLWPTPLLRHWLRGLVCGIPVQCRWEEERRGHPWAACCCWLGILKQLPVEPGYFYFVFFEMLCSCVLGSLPSSPSALFPRVHPLFFSGVYVFTYLTGRSERKPTLSSLDTGREVFFVLFCFSFFSGVGNTLRLLRTEKHAFG